MQTVKVPYGWSHPQDDYGQFRRLSLVVQDGKLSNSVVPGDVERDCLQVYEDGVPRSPVFCSKEGLVEWLCGRPDKSSVYNYGLSPEQSAQGMTQEEAEKFAEVSSE